MNVLCPGKRPYYKRIALPVTTYIDAKKLVVGYNLLYLCTWIVSIIYFVFYTKGWSEPTEVTSSTTMWLDASGKYLLKRKFRYCDNKEYDYFLYGKWSYSNISCKNISADTLFSKGVAPGSYWISTLYVDEDYYRSSGESVPNSRRMYFPTNIENMILGLLLFGRVPEIGYVSQLSYTRIYFKLPRTLSRKKIKNAYDVLGLKYDPAANNSLMELTNYKRCNGNLCWGDADPKTLRITFKVSQWLHLAGVDLDTYNNTLYDRVGISYGNAHTRLTGIGINMNIEFRNVPVNTVFSLPSEELAVVISLEVDYNWQRITLGKSSSLQNTKYVQSDSYGMRFVTRMVRGGDAKGLVGFSFRALVTSIFDVVIFFSMMRMFTTIVIFNLIGSKSKQWRKAAKKHIRYYVKSFEHEKAEVDGVDIKIDDGAFSKAKQRRDEANNNETPTDREKDYAEEANECGRKKADTIELNEIQIVENNTKIAGTERLDRMDLSLPNRRKRPKRRRMSAPPI